MRRFLLVVSLTLLTAVSGLCQNTTVTATVTDTTSIAWANGTWNFTLNNPQGGQPVYASTGQRVITGFQGTMDSTGTFTIAGIAQNAAVVPQGTTWRITVCPAATSTNAKPTCYSLLRTVSGSTLNLSAQLSAIAVAPTDLIASQLAAAYTSASLATPPSIGYTYFDSTQQALGTWNGNQWVYFGGGGGGGASPGTTNCATFPGATGGDKIAACLASMPNGGIADASGLTGNQTFPSQIIVGNIAGTQPIVLRMGKSNWAMQPVATGVNTLVLGTNTYLKGCGTNCTTFTTPVATNDDGHPVTTIAGAHDIEISDFHCEGNATSQPSTFEHQDCIFPNSTYALNVHDITSHQIAGSLVSLFGDITGAGNIASNVCTAGACTLTTATAHPTWTTSTRICVIMTWGGQTIPGGTAPADICFQIGGVTSPTVFTYTNGTYTGSTTTAGLVVQQNVTGEVAQTVTPGIGVFQFKLASPSVPPGTLTLTANGTTFTDNSFSAMFSSTGIAGGFSSGSIDYGSGNVSLSFLSATSTSISSTTTVVTIVGTNQFSAGQTVHLSGFTSPLGLLLNGTTQTVASAIQANYTINFANAGFASVSDTHGFSTTAPAPGTQIIANYASGTQGFTSKSTFHALKCVDSLRGCVSIIVGRWNHFFDIITSQRYGFSDLHIEPNSSQQWVDHNTFGPAIEIYSPNGGGISSTHQTNANIACSGNTWHDIVTIGGSASFARCPYGVYENLTFLNPQSFQTFLLNGWGNTLNNINIISNPVLSAPPTNTTGAFGMQVSGQVANNQSGAPIGYGKNIISNVRIEGAWGSCLVLGFSNDSQLTNIHCLNVQNSQSPVLLTTANGFNINNSSNVYVNGARIDDNQATPTMQRGVSDISNTNLSLNNVIITNAQNNAYLATTTTGTACYNVTGCRAASAFGFVPLVAGTATVTNTAACLSTAASCNYQLSNCAASGTPGELSVGTVVAGTSFVINSSNAADASRVCWRIN